MYITAITQNLSKKCCMQYLSPLFNYTGYKNKTSILHPSGSLPTERTLNPSSDPLSLAHPSPVFPHWLGWRTEPLEHGIPWGSRSQQWDLNPEEPSLPPSCCRALWGRAGQKDPGLLEWLGAGGWCLQPRGLSLAQLGWVWLKTPSQPGWEQLLAPLQDDSRAQDAEPECKRCWGWSSSGRGSTDATPLCLATLGLGAQTGLPEYARSLTRPQAPRHSAPWAVQLSIPLSCI